MKRIISFDLQADFGFFKKPDVNDGLQLSYNLLHKPALLGVLGAIAGMKGYEEKGQFPEYYLRLAGISVGVQPLPGHHEKGNFGKTAITYTNTVGYANKDGNLIVKEHTLIRPAYRCYLGLNPDEDEDHKTLYNNIVAGVATYVPYFGKNEFHAWWEPEKVREYDWTAFQPEGEFQVDSIFVKQYPLKDHRKAPAFDWNTFSLANASSFAYFERLPIYFKEQPGFVQYELAEFAFTDWVLKPSSKISQLFKLKNNQSIIQLF